MLLQCGHCKTMAPDWEKLAKDWEKSEIGLVAEVDCTDPDSETICQEFNVEGFPTLLHGDPSAPEEYQGGRDYESLSEFAQTFLGRPICGLTKTDNCSDEEKETIKKVLAMSKDDLMKVAEGVKTQMNAAQKALDEFIDEINSQYEAKSNEYNKNVASIKEEANFKWVQQALTKVHGLTPESLAGDDEDDKDEL
jgi:thiol-disulfide isomerase/thioredoxin